MDFVAKPIQADQVYECLRLHSGAQFDYAEPPPVMETPPAWEGVAVGLPEALHARLLTAAELHSTTALKSCLQDLRQIGPEGRMLAEQIRHLMRSYDMNGILRLLCQVTSPARASASPSQNHDFAST